jgi:erythromycin esterase
LEQLAQKVVTLNTVDPAGPTTDLDALSPLLRDKQIIGVGEASHGTSEFYKMRHRLFRYGVAHWGLRVLSVEMSFGAGTYLDDYIRTGQGNPTQILRDSGYWIYTTQEFAALLEWMKNYNVGKTEAERLKIYGFDMQPQGAVNSVNRLRAYFTQSAPSYVAAFNQATAFISEGYPEFNGLTPEQQAAAAPRISQQYQARINEVITYLTTNQAALTAQSGDATYRLALQHARVLLQGMTQVGLGEAGSEYRDEKMAQNVKWISESENNGKVMALAHNGHIQNGISAGAGRRDQKWMGTNLKELYGNRYYAVGFTFNEGGFRASSGSGIQSFTVRPFPGSLTGVFSALPKPLFFMDIASLSQNAAIRSVLDEPYPFYNAAVAYDNNERNAGGIYNLAQSYDGVIHIDKTTPTTGL